MTATTHDDGHISGFGTKGYRSYILTALLIVYILNFIDRGLLSVVAPQMKPELGISDTAFGLLTGFGFALLYTVVGIPLAQFAETRHRVAIMSVCVALWSLMTALCGLAAEVTIGGLTIGAFWILLACRVGVGVGEAGCTPPAHSLIADYVPKEKRASALAFYSMGTPLGGLLGLVMGGLVADAYGWRAAFLVAGLPGILFALLCWFTLKEPRKILAAHSSKIVMAQATFGETLKYLTKKKTFWLIALGAAIKAFIGYGHAPFTASFFMRVHGEEVAGLAAMFDLKSLGFLGLALGLVSGAAGAISSYAGGQVADKYAKSDLRGYVVVPAFASLLAVPVYIIAVSVPSASVALCILVINGLLGSLWYGPVYAIGQSIVPPHMRATTAAILLFTINLIGLGLGPLAVGILSDVMSNGFGLGSAQGVRWALMISTCFGFLAFALFWIARKTIREEMES
ncbi:MFS transporter [Phenylobacterium sp.]|uniref:spinster family MFS transporter n=1 Tax=Phenylobacterium sp. TaxID=1871053 RepID=UPI0027348275|nr:MFS transporter [Phenylobacterium sp.]MDP3853110.1 MFS transporter [Phenylobacterium sp.]